MSHEKAQSIAHSAVEAIQQGYYFNQQGEKVDWQAQIDHACSAKVSLPPDAALPDHIPVLKAETHVQVCNETTLQSGYRLIKDGLKPLALNFANGVSPGGGFLYGALAQEESLCRASALYQTLVGDPMYDFHQKRGLPDSTDWTIYSPDVPIFRNDDGTELDQPWTMSFLTSAAPVASMVGQPKSEKLLRQRIHRILAIASAYGYETLILGAWGCGAFHNDPYQTAHDFRKYLEDDFSGHFAKVIFAITDWSTERRFLRPFAKVFSADE